MVLWLVNSVMCVAAGIWSFKQPTSFTSKLIAMYRSFAMRNLCTSANYFLVYFTLNVRGYCFIVCEVLQIYLLIQITYTTFFLSYNWNIYLIIGFVQRLWSFTIKENFNHCLLKQLPKHHRASNFRIRLTKCLGFSLQDMLIYAFWKLHVVWFLFIYLFLRL